MKKLLRSMTHLYLNIPVFQIQSVNHISFNSKGEDIESNFGAPPVEMVDSGTLQILESILLETAHTFLGISS